MAIGNNNIIIVCGRKADLNACNKIVVCDLTPFDC